MTTLNKTLLLLCCLSFGFTAIFAQDAPYDPRPQMLQLQRDWQKEAAEQGDIHKQAMHFLVFGDSKHSPRLQDVLKIADLQKPDFCLTTADLVDRGAGAQGVIEYKKLDEASGWFFRKYPTWPTLGNHEVAGTGSNKYESGKKNFADFFGMDNPTYSFVYGNAKFIALDWPKVYKDPVKFAWLESELKAAAGKHIFIFRHRPFYTVGRKSQSDTEGISTATTELFKKYNVTAVFSGHDHIYYRTKRDGVWYITSAGAGARIYELNREAEAIEGDVYYGREAGVGPKKINKTNNFRFHTAHGIDYPLTKALYFIVSVKIAKDRIVIEMIDTNGKVWDHFIFRNTTMDVAPKKDSPKQTVKGE